MNLLDSNVVIAGASREGAALDDAVFARPYATSVITRIEVLGFARLTAEDDADLRAFLAGGQELALTDAVIDTAVRLRQERRMSLGDAVIAATALVHDLPLLTRNVDDFQHVVGLRVSNPFVAAPERAPGD